MNEYYCRLCGIKHLQASDDIICPTCDSRYCILSIKNAIDEGRYNCSYCPEKLIETYGTTPLIQTEVTTLQALVKQIGKSIPKVAEIKKEETTGFTMNRDNRVIGLGIFKQDLNSLPENIGKLHDLETLILASNQLTSLPETLGNLANLKRLDLRRNQLTSLPETLGQLKNLQELVLLDNQLTSLPETLGKLENLQKLNLWNNQLTSLPESLGQLTNLQILYLNYNQLTSLPETLGNLRDLQILYLNHNQLTSLSETLGNLKNLKRLDLIDNQLTSLPETLEQWLADLEINGCLTHGTLKKLQTLLK